MLFVYIYDLGVSSFSTILEISSDIYRYMLVNFIRNLSVTHTHSNGANSLTIKVILVVWVFEKTFIKPRIISEEKMDL